MNCSLLPHCAFKSFVTMKQFTYGCMLDERNASLILFCSLEILAKSFPLLTIFTIKSVNKKLKEFFKVQKECKKHNLLKITLVALLIKTGHFRQFSATFGPFCTDGKICHLTMPTWFRRLIYGMSITHVPLHLSI